MGKTKYWSSDRMQRIYILLCDQNLPMNLYKTLADFNILRLPVESPLYSTPDLQQRGLVQHRFGPYHVNKGNLYTFWPNDCFSMGMAFTLLSNGSPECNHKNEQAAVKTSFTETTSKSQFSLQ